MLNICLIYFQKILDVYINRCNKCEYNDEFKLNKYFIQFNIR